MDRFKQRSQEQQLWLLFWIGLFFVMVFRHFFFGLQYFNYLDDYNTYGIFFRRNSDIWNNVIQWYKLYTFRPIAFFADAYITQWFWPCMWVVLLFYTVMHFFTCFIFHQTLKKCNLPAGFLSIILIALTPYLCEAVYWIGASTRLVPGMFFSILSGYLLILFLESEFKNRGQFISFFISNLVANGFYEQIVVFNFFYILMILFINRQYFIGRWKFIWSVPFINTALIGLYYMAFSNQGKLSQRSKIIPIELMPSQAKTVIKTIWHMMTDAQMLINREGLPEGIRLIQSPLQGFIVAVIILFIIVLFIQMIRFDKPQVLSLKNLVYGFLFGLVLFVVPFAPFFVLQDSYLFARGAYPSFFGLALAAQAVLNGLASIRKCNKVFRWFKALVSVILIMPFFLITIAEVNNYKLIEDTDQVIMERLLTAFEATGLPEETTVVLFNTQARYPETSSPRYENVTSSDWSLIGMANAVSEQFYFKRMMAIYHNRWLNAEEVLELTGQSVYFGMDAALEIVPLELDEDMILRYSRDASVFGALIPDGDGFRFYYQD